MKLEKKIFILLIFFALISVIGVYAENTHNDTVDIQEILENNTPSELTGCCSVVLQEDGNNCMMAFRRDAGNAADIFIEKIDWNGTEAIKQYKTDAGYFVQVIITHDGWVIGYGGIDDGPDNEKVEKITRGMINDNNTISEKGLEEVQQIKAAYGIGHLVIKAPNGNYGVATADTHFTGKLKPGEYISEPNRVSFFRSGSMPANTTDKISYMVGLAISDGFGLTRRDVTTFDYDQISNDTFTGNVTNIYVSNDDGSMYGMSTGGLCDNVFLNKTKFNAEDIPIAPKYHKLGNITFTEQQDGGGGGNSSPNLTVHMIFFIIFFPIVVGILFFKVLGFVRSTRRRYRR